MWRSLIRHRIRQGITAVETAHLNIESAREEKQIERWRYEQLRGAGYDHATARELASRPEVDLHLAVDLLRRGCLPDLALRILG